jgi:hypothetical protein
MKTLLSSSPVWEHKTQQKKNGQQLFCCKHGSHRLSLKRFTMNSINTNQLHKHGSIEAFVLSEFSSKLMKSFHSKISKFLWVNEWQWYCVRKCT